MIVVKQLYGGKNFLNYLLDSVSHGAGDQRVMGDATAYYAEAGTPAGTWLGSGLAGLGAGTVRAGSVVTPEALHDLIGEGKDPVTGELLGRAFRRDLTRKQRIDAAVAQAQLADLPADERARQLAAIKERIAAQPQGARAVHGFDFTFAPPKAVSTLWALADAGLRQQIYQAHRDALASTIKVMERDMARTRQGTNGVVQTETLGLVAAAFDHWDSRAHDPHLHTHVVVANRVQGTDGKWRTLDSRGTVFPGTVAMSETYDNYLMDGLAATLGARWHVAREGKTLRSTVWGIQGVPDDLVDEFSQRRHAIDAARTPAGGRGDDQEAWATTRTDKEHLSLEELTSRWHARARQVLGSTSLVDVVRRATGHAVRQARVVDVSADVDDLADEVIARLEQSRGHWSEWNIRAETARTTRKVRMVDDVERDDLEKLITNRVKERCVDLSVRPEASVPARYRRADGSSRFVSESSYAWTTRYLLEAEDRLRSAAGATTAPAITADGAFAQLNSWRSEDGYQLTGDQAGAVFDIATSGRLLDVLVGPAGAGKTTALAALRDTWEHVHGKGSVVGLALSAAAAEVLAESLGIPTENTAMWLTSARSKRGSKRRALKAGDLVIVDEASMAATSTLDEITAEAAQVGAKVLTVGDWAQLAAVGAGGGFGMLVRSRKDVPTLATVHRFKSAWEREASLALRVGDQCVIDTYVSAGRIHGGDAEAAAQEAYRAWLEDTSSGRRSLLIAPDNATARELSMRARADLVAARKVAAEGTAIAEGAIAGVGDLVVTRLNDRKIKSGSTWVKNGSTWRVCALRNGGALLVEREGTTDRLLLPAHYVREHVDLAYALTAHRAQGLTVDTAHAIVADGAMTRELLYVAMTRGAHENHAYVATADVDADHAWSEQDAPGTRDVLVAAMRSIGAPLMAREHQAQQVDQTRSIAQLAAEYDTIARDGRARNWAGHLERSLGERVAADVTTAPGWEQLVRVLHSVETSGIDLHDIVPALANAAPLNEEDPAADLAARTTAWSGGRRPTSSTGLIVGLVPRARATDPDMDRH